MHPRALGYHPLFGPYLGLFMAWSETVSFLLITFGHADFTKKSPVTSFIPDCLHTILLPLAFRIALA